MGAENKNPGQENFDRWLDAVLHARAHADPRIGLEDRVLARLATEHPRSTFSWMPMLAAVAAVVAVSLALIVTDSNKRSGQITSAAAPNAHISEAPSVRASSTIPDIQHSRKTTAHRIERARPAEALHAGDGEQASSTLAAFPASVPATQQERMLVELARGANAKDLANFSETLVPLKDVEISSLQVDPLDSENNGPH